MAAPEPLRILAISGSLRKASTNTAALEAMARVSPSDVSLTLYRDLASLPPFNPEEDGEGVRPPEAVGAFRAAVGRSDALLIASPEYAHGIAGALKNALDWLVASDTFPGKPVALINAAPRAFHAQASLREVLSTMAARVIPEAFVSLSLTGRSVTVDDIVADADCARRLRESLVALSDALRGK